MNMSCWSHSYDTWRKNFINKNPICIDWALLWCWRYLTTQQPSVSMWKMVLCFDFTYSACSKTLYTVTPLFVNWYLLPVYLFVECHLTCQRHLIIFYLLVVPAVVLVILFWMHVLWIVYFCKCQVNQFNHNKSKIRRHFWTMGCCFRTKSRFWESICKKWKFPKHWNVKRKQIQALRAYEKFNACF